MWKKMNLRFEIWISWDLDYYYAIHLLCLYFIFLIDVNVYFHPNSTTLLIVGDSRSEKKLKG